MKALVLFAAALTLGGCVGPATVSGECRIFRDPGRVVHGATRQDQHDIDVDFVEPGIAGCGWRRPKS